MPSIDLRVVILVLDDQGGMRLYAESLCTALATVCDARLVCIKDEDGLAKKTWLGRVADKFHYGRRLRRIYDPSRFTRIASMVVAMHKPELVHITSDFPCMNSLVSQFGRLGVKVVYTVHDPLPHPQKKSFRGRFQSWFTQRYFLPKVLRKVDRVHVHSGLHVDVLFRETVGIERERIYVVQHGGGTTPSIMKGDIRPAEISNLPESSRSILFFGRIELYKGLDTLFAALPEVLSHYPNVRVIVAGAGQLPNIPTLVSDKCVVINRYIDEREIRAIFEVSSLVVLPYRSATQTGVISLAASFAKPCLVTNVGALPELVVEGVTGAVVAPENPHQLARKMIAMLVDDHQLHTMGLAAQDFMWNTYAWPLVASRHLEEYSRLEGR